MNCIGAWYVVPGSYILFHVFFFQFFVYFFYFTLLTVIYLGCAAWVITRHYHNRRQEQVPTEAIASTELSPVEKAFWEETSLQWVRTWKLGEFDSDHGEVDLGLLGFSVCPEFFE